MQDMDIRHIPSMRRNQVISDVFSRLHYMERRGSGIDRIMTSYAECAQKPVFYSDSTFFLVTLPNRSVAAPAQLSMESENVETSTQNMETTAQNVETSPQNVETSAFSTPIEKLERDLSSCGCSHLQRKRFWNCSSAMGMNMNFARVMLRMYSMSKTVVPIL